MNNIYTRVSVRQYEDRPVEPEKITEILRAGMQAPSCGNQQPWEFYVVTNKEKLIALSESHRYAGCAANAPAAIVPVYRKKGLWLPEYAHIDMAIAQENMWLMTDLEAFSIFVLGYPAGAKKAQENRFDENRIHYVV